MHGLPTDFDGHEFVGLEVDWVCFAAYTVALKFGAEASITLESSFTYSLGAGGPELTETVPPVSSQLFGLVGKAVASVSADRSGELILRFGDGSFFRCTDDQAPQYESYTISVGEEEIVV